MNNPLKGLPRLTAYLSASGIQLNGLERIGTATMNEKNASTVYDGAAKPDKRIKKK